MEYILNFYMILTMTILVILGVRSVYLSFKLHNYISNTDPEKAKVIGISPEGSFNGFKFYKYIFDKSANETDEIVNKLKRLVKNSIEYAIIFMVLTPLGAILLMLILRQNELNS